MSTLNYSVFFDESRKLQLIDTLGQIEALALSVHFKVNEYFNEEERLGFYLGTLFHDLLNKLKMLIDQLIAAYEQLTED